MAVKVWSLFTVRIQIGPQGPRRAQWAPRFATSPNLGTIQGVQGGWLAAQGGPEASRHVTASSPRPSRDSPERALKGLCGG
eukprot:9753027-Alexandrium_andersonii.AAC.1